VCKAHEKASGNQMDCDDGIRMPRPSRAGWTGRGR
jgi:hypothetical protein